MKLPTLQLGWMAALLLSGLGLTGCATPGTGSEAGGLTGNDEDSYTETEKRIKSLAHYATGLSYDLNDKSDLALNEMVSAARTDPGNEAIVVEAVRRCLRGGKAALAVDLLVNATSVPGASGTLYAWLGLAYAQLGKTEAAIQANRTAIKKAPDSLPAYQNLAQLYLQNSRTNDALQVLDQAAAQPIEDPGYLIELADLYAGYGRVQTSQGELVKNRVLRVLDRAAYLKPMIPLQILRLADGYYNLGELKKAEPFYRQLVEEHADLPTIRGKLTEIYLRSGQKDKASEQLEALTRNEPTNSKAYLVLGAMALEDKKFQEASEHFERALKLDPQNLELEQVYFDLAGIKLSLKKPEEALAILEQARAKFKLSFPLEFYTGIAYAAGKKYNEALSHLTSAEAIAKATEPGRLSHFFYFQMGSTHERAGRIEEAEKYFRESLKLSPDDPETLNYLGYMWAEHGIKLDEALVMIEKAVKQEPKNAAFLDSLAWVLYKMNKPKEALVSMLKAIEHAEEPDATLFDHLGDIYSALQQFEQAREAWKKALQVEPNDQIQKKLDAASPDGPKPP